MKGTIARIAMAYAAVALIQGTALASPPIHADVMMLVRDEKGQPLPGVNVVLDFADPAETKKERIKVAGKSGVTDEHGIVNARAFIGWSDPGERKIEVDSIMVTASKAGYQTFHDTNEFFYVATRAQDRFTVYLHDVQLAPEGSAEQSRIKRLGLHPTAVVDPPYGDSAAQFTLQAKLDVPEVLTRTIDKPLFRMGIMQTSSDPKKPDAELLDDGKAPDLKSGDGIFTAALLPPAGSAQVVQSIDLIVRPKDDFNMLVWGEGRRVRWIETKRTMRGLSLYTRWVSVHANIVGVPVKWVVADDREKAHALYREKFGGNEK